MASHQRYQASPRSRRARSTVRRDAPAAEVVGMSLEPLLLVDGCGRHDGGNLRAPDQV
ncbi:hypothetical protein ACFPRL_32620 [Pseudoclavibacter helvolus]